MNCLKLPIALVLMLIFNVAIARTPQKATVKNQRKVDSVLIKTDSIRYKNFTLKVDTYYLADSVVPTLKRMFKPIVLKQQLTFLKNGKVLVKRLNNSRQVYQQTVKGKNVRMLSIVYYHLYVVEGTRKTVFAIGGTGGCNSCTETLDFFMPTGVYAYANSSTRNFDVFLKDSGITNYSTSTNEITIYPF